ncbi:MAG: cyclase family protein [Isosphaeraceae bacterium]
MTRLIDLSHPLHQATPPWPGNPPVTVDVLDAIPASRGAGRRPGPDEARHVNVTAFRTCNHTGTHMDSPLHFYHGVPTIDQLPLDQCIGPATLVDVRALGPRGVIRLADVQPHEASLVATRKVVFRTGWSSRWGQPEYFEDYPTIDEAAARWLVDRGVRLVGIDTPSVDREPNPAHYVFLGSQACIVENLTNLDQISESPFELIAVPLPLQGLDGSPVRAVARIPG